MTIITLDDHRPHKAGQAMCWLCGHQWTAVAPASTYLLACPHCDYTAGVMHGDVSAPGPATAAILSRLPAMQAEAVAEGEAEWVTDTQGYRAFRWIGPPPPPSPK